MKKIGRFIIDALIVCLYLIPLYWMALTSLKTVGQSLANPPSFFVSNPQWINYVTVFKSIPLLSMLKNSIIVTIGIMVCQAITVIPAAYAFSRFKFKGDGLLFSLVLLTMMIPAQLIFLPVFLLFSKFNLINNVLSLILPSATSAFAIFMLRQNFMQIPEELFEAAILDKASKWKIVWKIMLPIAIPTIATLGMLTFISAWNDYFWPFVLTTENAARTLPVGIVSLKNSENGLPHHIIMAGNMILAAPVLAVFFAAQKQIIRGFTYMGDK